MEYEYITKSKRFIVSNSYRKWIKYIIKNMRNPIFFTITHKLFNNTNYKSEYIREFVFNKAKYATRDLLSKINRVMFRNSYRHGKRMPFIGFFEFSNNDRIHEHSIIDLPDHISIMEYRSIVTKSIQIAKNIYTEFELEPVNNVSIANYITKSRCKYGITDSFDEINTNASFSN